MILFLLALQQPVKPSKGFNPPPHTPPIVKPAPSPSPSPKKSEEPLPWIFPPPDAPDDSKDGEVQNTYPENLGY